MNSVSLIGRLTRDPDLRYTQNGLAVVRFTLACDRRMSKQKRAEAEANRQQTADFISCVAFGQLAELIANYHTKGSQLGVEGRIQTGSYQREDNSTVYTTDVVVENITFIGTNAQRSQGGFNQGSGMSQNQGGFNQGYNQGGFQDKNTPVNSAYNNNGFSNDDSSNNDEFFPIDNDDIPF